MPVERLPVPLTPPPSALAEVPTVALIYGLGHTAATPTKLNLERIAALADELHLRGELRTLMDLLEPQMARSLGFVLTNAKAAQRDGARQRRRLDVLSEGG